MLQSWGHRVGHNLAAEQQQRFCGSIIGERTAHQADICVFVQKSSIFFPRGLKIVNSLLS